MSEPLTSEERQAWKAWAEQDPDAAYNSSIAHAYLRYEATLQAKDERIEQLENGLLAIIAIEAANPRRRKLEIAQRIARAAIKEATHG